MEIILEQYTINFDLVNYPHIQQILLKCLLYSLAIHLIQEYCEVVVLSPFYTWGNSDLARVCDCQSHREIGGWARIWIRPASRWKNLVLAVMVVNEMNLWDVCQLAEQILIEKEGGRCMTLPPCWRRAGIPRRVWGDWCRKKPQGRCDKLSYRVPVLSVRCLERRETFT